MSGRRLGVRLDITTWLPGPEGRAPAGRGSTDLRPLLLRETGSTQRMADAQGAGEKAPDGMLEAVQTAGGLSHTTECLIGSEPAIADVIGEHNERNTAVDGTDDGGREIVGRLGVRATWSSTPVRGVAELVSGAVDVHLGQVP